MGGGRREPCCCWRIHQAAGRVWRPLRCEICWSGRQQPAAAAVPGTFHHAVQTLTAATQVAQTQDCPPSPAGPLTSVQTLWLSPLLLHPRAGSVQRHGPARAPGRHQGLRGGVCPRCGGHLSGGALRCCPQPAAGSGNSRCCRSRSAGGATVAAQVGPQVLLAAVLRRLMRWKRWMPEVRCCCCLARLVPIDGCAHV